MKRTVTKLVAALAAIALGVVARAGDPMPPPNAAFSGTTEISWGRSDALGRPVFPKRLGIVAYCADIYHGAGDIGLQADKQSISHAPWEIHSFSRTGNYGAQNVADYMVYDDGIDRIRDVQVIDGDLANPTSTQLINNFDIVIAYTDNKCGPTLPTAIANSATAALTGFVASPGKKLILTGFAFTNGLGFGAGLYSAGMSPFRKAGANIGNAACSRDTFWPDGSPAPGPCHVGVCPAGCTLDGAPPTCVPIDPLNPPATCRTQYEPSTATTLGAIVNGNTLTPVFDPACTELLNNVRGPTSSSWATNLSTQQVQNGALLCFNYNAVNPNAAPGSPPLNGGGVPFIAVNQARNIYAVNAFPPDRADIQKFWYSCLFGNIVELVSGSTNRCPAGDPFCGN